jgi:hypothetical protein
VRPARLRARVSVRIQKDLQCLLPLFILSPTDLTTSASVLSEPAVTFFPET